LDVRVIVHGDGYKFFRNDMDSKEYKALAKRLYSLSKNYNVSFEICEAGVKERKLTAKNFYPFVSMVPNSTIGLIDAQNEGFAYIPLR